MTIDSPHYQQRQRLTQRDVQPAAIKQRALGSDIISNSSTSTTSVAGVTNGSTVTLTTITTAAANPNIPLGLLGIGMSIFHTSLDFANYIIGDSNYVITGPILAATLSPETDSGTTYFSDGNNLVFKTTVTNNSGGTKTIIFANDVRILLGIGGGT